MITPELLVSQVRNTAPYVFEEGEGAWTSLPPACFVRELDRAPSSLSHFETFRLCLCAHYLTCATPVPTDVDNQIRRKLWEGGLPLETVLAMAELVLASHDWDFLALTARASFGAGAFETAALHGHFGEWFTVAAGAYAALAAYSEVEAKDLRVRLLAAIAAEIDRHARIFGSLWRAKDGLGALRASASIAHNLGDLDRVIEMWDVPITDPLRLRYAKLTASAFGSERELRYEGRLWTAGELYKSKIDGSSMAGENHRHFALRKPRAIRTRSDLRVPLGPFFDEWGARVAAVLEGEARAAVIEALVQGSERLPASAGYLRALHAIGDEAAIARFKKDPKQRAVLAMTREAFEARWNERALALLDEIPSRA